MLREPGVVPWAVSVLLLSFRFAPIFAFAPPFTLIGAPAIFRALLGVGLSAAILETQPATAYVTDLSLGAMAGAAVRELLIGLTFALALQIVFAALYTTGRLIDIQAGHGLAAVVDPQTRANLPLVGSLFGYAFGALFFSIGGDIDLLRLLAGSVQAIPVGQGQGPSGLAPLAGYMSIVFLTALGVGGGAILSLFIADVGIAMLTRAAPQMNALVFGFQAKTLLLLLILPPALAASAAAMARLARLSLEGAAGLLR